MRIDLVLSHWQLFAQGVWMTLQLTFLALAAGLLIALPAGIVRARRKRFWSPAFGAYVYLFRGTPLLVQTYLIYFGLSQFEAVRDSWAWSFLREPWWCALIAFSLNSGAYATEIIRGAIETTPRGEREAAIALGLHPRQADWLVIVPSALRRALPQLGNEVVFMLHGSVVASVITLQDILGVGRTLNARYYLAYEGFVTAAVLYMAITGVVFAILLSGLQAELQTTVPWVDFVVHKLMPVVLVVDWLLDRPRHRLPRWTILAWLAYPAAWLTYTLIRGASVDWYPYPFVDVSRLGYDGVLARAAVLTLGFTAAAAALRWLGNRRAR
jgi:arginine/ornithine transport system permease protein